MTEIQRRSRVTAYPKITALAGLPPAQVQPVKAILGAELPANDERQEYMRVPIEKNSERTLVATAFDTQDSSMLANLTRADALLIRPISAPAGKIGDGCEVVLLR